MPGISDDRKANENSDEHASPRGGNITLGLTLPQTLLMNTDTRQKCKLTVPIP